MKLAELPWLRIGAEFAVIFLGVSLSLAADDWRQSRELRDAERDALTEVTADLVADSIELVSVLIFADSWDRSAVWVRRRLDDRSLNPDSALAYLTRLRLFDLYQPVASTYVGLKAGGQLTLIRDQSLRRSIVAYYEVHQPFMLEFAELAGRVHAEYTEVLKAHSLPRVPDQGSFWPPGPREFTTSWAAFADDPRTAPAVTDLGITAGNWALRVREVLEANSALRAAIASSSS